MICGAEIPKDVWMPESLFRSLFTPAVPGKSTKKHNSLTGKAAWMKAERRWTDDVHKFLIRKV
jgi:hypothetical protein